MTKLKLSVALLMASALFAFKAKAQNIGDLYPNSLEMIESGEMLYKEEKYLDAIEKFKQVEDGDSLYFRAQYELALTYQADSQYTTAIQVADNLIKQYPKGNHKSKILKAQILDISGKSDESIAHFTELIKEIDYLSIFYNERSASYLKKGKYDLALKDMTEALRLNPLNGNTHIKIGLAAAEADQPALAIMALFFSTIVDSQNPNLISIISVIEAIGQNNYKKNYDDVSPELFSFASELDEINEIVNSKTALNAKYKSKLKANYSYAKQLQVISEMLSPSYSSDNSIVQFYTSFYKQMWDMGHFIGMVSAPLSSIQDPKVQAIAKKNKKKIDAFIAEGSRFVGKKGERISFTFQGEKKIGDFNFENNNLSYIMVSDVVNSDHGQLIYFYANGELKSMGNFAQNQREGEWRFYSDNGVLTHIVNYKNGQRQGKMTEFDRFGVIQSETEYVNDKEMGKMVLYYPNGARKSEFNIINGAVAGVASNFNIHDCMTERMEIENNKLKNKLEAFNPDGSVQYEAKVTNGSMNGPIISKNEKGILISEGAYADGKRNGVWKFYDDNGKLNQKGTYENGDIIGIWEYYDEKGNITETKNYKNNKLNGESIIYDRSQKILSKINYRNGKGIDYAYFDTNGNTIYTAKLNTNKINVITYNELRIKSSEGLVVNDNETGVWKYYYPNGSLQKEINYKDGQIEGLVKEYYETGEIKMESFYKAGLMQGYYKRYNVLGQKTVDSYMLDGELHGPWKSYYPNGELKSREFNWYGVLNGNAHNYTPDGKLFKTTRFNNDYMSYVACCDTTGVVCYEENVNLVKDDLKLVHPNGKTNFESKIQFGFRTGQINVYDPQGNLEEELNYQYGALNGNFKAYYMDGKIQQEGQYKNDEKDGQWTYYDEGGKLSSKITYKHNERNGPCIYYHDNGTVFQERNYLDDDRDGQFKYYDETGALMIILNYNQGVLLSYSYNDASGKPVADIPVQNETGTITGKYPNGKTSIKFGLLNGEFDGEYLIYHSNGQLIDKSNNMHGSDIGTRYTYNSKGVLLSQEEYELDSMHGHCVYYHENGKLQSEITYRYGVRHGPAKYYDKNGKLKHQGNYYNDAYIQN